MYDVVRSLSYHGVLSVDIPEKQCSLSFPPCSPPRCHIGDVNGTVRVDCQLDFSGRGATKDRQEKETPQNAIK
ncbi:unnamed protein product [Onchocerca flexuosa]|uniref:ZP domain-containing protein n=1 Tax=Onchocerca flexuosa TaxID=387005 RepID=A0A183H3S4_9BILA|nr:unnamed protein product [Onchocerca flexuosa]